MLRKLFGLACFATLAATAHADAIDDFTFVTTAHTLTFSLPAEVPDYYPPGYPPPGGGGGVAIDNFYTSAVGAIDGVGGYTFNLDFIVDGAVQRGGFLIYLGNTIANYNVNGQILVTAPYQYFPLGTFSYFDIPSYGHSPDPGQIFEGPYTLTITQQITATPEPGTITLLLLGSLACLPLLRRQLTLPS